MRQIKIRLIAIAKDEAAYLANWIYHHLFVGFDSIHVCVNRTTDNSISLLEKIAQKKTNVTYEEVDWVDGLNSECQANIQKIVYAKTIYDARCLGYTHVMFLDIDEFYITRELRSVKEDIIRLGNPHAITFPWLIRLGTSVEFDYISHKFNFHRSQLTKSLYSLEYEVNKVGVHICRQKNQPLPILPDGSDYIVTTGYHLSPALVKDYTSHVMHDMYRSPLEYLSSLCRGNCRNNLSEDIKVKFNRGGYFEKWHKDNSFTFESNAYLDLVNYIQEGIENAGIEHEIEEGRMNVRNKVEALISMWRNDDSSIDKSAKSFNGVRHILG